VHVCTLPIIISKNVSLPIEFITGTVESFIENERLQKKKKKERKNDIGDDDERRPLTLCGLKTEVCEPPVQTQQWPFKKGKT